MAQMHDTPIPEDQVIKYLRVGFAGNISYQGENSASISALNINKDQVLSIEAKSNNVEGRSAREKLQTMIIEMLHNAPWSFTKGILNELERRNQ
jgi:hypothetical protein